MPSSDIHSFRKSLAGAQNIIILSGAGLSAASGAPFFLVCTGRLTHTPLKTSSQGLPTYHGSTESLWSKDVSRRDLDTICQSIFLLGPLRVRLHLLPLKPSRITQVHRGNSTTIVVYCKECNSQ